MAKMTQLYRPIAINTPLGDDVLILSSVTITEQLGRMFQIEATLTTEQPDIDFTKIVGQNASIRLTIDESTERYWNGYVSNFTQVGVRDHLPFYKATIVPWLAFLGRTADFRIFQKKSVPDIIKKILSEGGYSDFRFSFSGTYTPWENCVQYRETSLNFISRLMEQEGLYTFFEHENGKHTLVLADSATAHEPYPGYETIHFQISPNSTGGGLESISAWQLEQKIVPGKYETMDYDFKNPRKLLRSTASDPKGHAAADYAVFDFPGEWDQSSDGDHYTRMRLEELVAQHETVRATTNAKGVAAGYTFTLADHPRADQNTKYLITSAVHTLSLDNFTSGQGVSAGALYSCQLTAINAKTQYRAPRITPKPVVQGPQTAIVVGNSGDEITTDEFGRIKIQFHWDRYGKRDQDSSAWARVAQTWAGKKWGTMFIPRVGMEVLVEFIEGDPDIPIITGCLYNGEAKPPYELPRYATRTYIKTNSSKGGGGFNELRFEDAKGKEQIFINAEKDHDLRVKHVSKELVGASRHLIVGGDQHEKVDGDKHLKVKGDQNEKVDGTVSLETGKDLQQKVGGKHAIDAAMESYIKGGMNVTIEAGVQLTLKVGGNFVTINAMGVSIQGSLVLINSGGAAGQGSACAPTPPKPPAEADQSDPGDVLQQLPPPPPPKPFSFSDAAKVLKQAAQSGAPFCEQCSRGAGS